MNGGLWDAIDNPVKQNRKQRRAAEKNTARSIRVGVFKRGGKHRRKALRSPRMGTS
jgi:hypothetical protein